MRRVVITGATGNVGSALVRALGNDPSVDAILGIARRPAGAAAEGGGPKASFVAADVAAGDLVSLFDGADAVVHLAWQLQPAHRPSELERTNVIGTRLVLDAAATARVERVVVASSVGVYAPGPKDRMVDEWWPATGVATSTYSRQKAEMERLCDAAARSGQRVIRMRPGLIFQRTSAMSQRRLFASRLLPPGAMRRRFWPVVPWVAGLRFQAVHAADVAEAYRLALHADVDGAFNLAAGPVIDAAVLGGHLDRPTVQVPPRAARLLHAGGFHARLVTSEPGWLDLAMASPLISSDRAHEALGWRPSRSALDALDDLADGMRHHAAGPTAALSASGH
jgi:nucleoside-diphosphate-sugar epimerase